MRESTFILLTPSIVMSSEVPENMAEMSETPPKELTVSLGAS